MAADATNELFSSLASDIKNYDGKDPLRPWLHGIKKMRGCLPPLTLNEKLPRFLQKCAQTFQSDRRYRNDSRYIGVWIQLMDFVDDPKVLLKMMEKHEIGTKRAAFYMAYAIFYEKRKKFDEAEKMYHAGVENLAQPIVELQKAYEQFLHRMALYTRRKQKVQEMKAKMAFKAYNPDQNGRSINKSDDCDAEFQPTGEGHHCSGQPFDTKKPLQQHQKSFNLLEGQSGAEDHHPHFRHAQTSVTARNLKPDGRSSVENNSSVGSANFSRDERHQTSETLKEDTVYNDDTVVVKFVGSAIVGKSKAEDACHHGLVDPTINMKEAIDAISNMFREPLEMDSKFKRKSQQQKLDPYQASDGFEVYVDEDFTQEIRDQKNAVQNTSILGAFKNCDLTNPTLSVKNIEAEGTKPFVGAFQILADDDDDNCNVESYQNLKHCDKISNLAVHDMDASTFLEPGNLPSRNCEDSDGHISEQARPREDTIIRRFVGSAMFDEPEIENACHHGLVDPTINMKEAMDDINSMFGKPINFVKPRKPKNQDNFSCQSHSSEGFLILVDEDMVEPPKSKSSDSSPVRFEMKNDFFEPTTFTKEAMDEINSLFGRPLDF